MDVSAKVPKAAVRSTATTVNLQLKPDLLRRIDARRSERYPSRTQVIRELLFWALDQQEIISKTQAAQ